MAFYLLGLSILLVFLPINPVYIKSWKLTLPIWSIVAALSVLVAWLEGTVDFQGVAVVVVYSALLAGSLGVKTPLFKNFILLSLGLYSLALATHALPGFSNLFIVKNSLITPDAVPFSLYANFDKGLVGLFLIAYFFRGKSENAYFIKPVNWGLVCVIVLITIAASLGLAAAFGMIRFEPKVPPFWLTFLLINVFFTCVAEEAFFRGFLQWALSRVWSDKPYWVLSPVVSALLFGAAHFSAGIEYVFVATVAGLGYAYIFHRTGRIELAILCHFALNLVHFFFFTYPMLATVSV